MPSGVFSRHVLLLEHRVLLGQEMALVDDKTTSQPGKPIDVLPKQAKRTPTVDGGILHHPTKLGMMISLQIPTNTCFPLFQSGAKWIPSIHSMFWRGLPPLNHKEKRTGLKALAAWPATRRAGLRPWCDTAFRPAAYVSQ